MTEFFDLGKHCCVETCRQKDFLPFTCTHCQKHFCSEHRECATHHCPAYNIDEELKRSHIPTCPLCNQLVTKRFPNEDNNIVIERHIRSGCKIELTNKTRHICSFVGCDEDQMVKCSSCSKSYCSDHRHADDHQCSAATHKHHHQNNSSIINNEKKKLPSAEPTNSVLKKLHQDRRTNVNSTTTSKITKTAATATPTSSAASLNNSSSASTTTTSYIVPLKNKTLDDDDSVKTTVYLTLNQSSNGIPMKLSKMWSVGKTLDLLADYAKIKNVNNNLNTSPEDRLSIYKINHGEVKTLDNSKRIGDVLQNGDILIMDTKRSIETTSEKNLNEMCISVNPCGRESASFLDKLKRNYKQIFTQ